MSFWSWLHFFRSVAYTIFLPCFCHLFFTYPRLTTISASGSPQPFFLVEWYKETLVLQERETCSHKDGKNIHVSHAHAFFVLRGCDCDRLSDIWNLFFTSHTHTHTLFFLGACDKAKCVMVHLIYNLFLLSGYSTETAIISQLLHFLAGALVGLWCFTGNDCLFTF